jgi:hypothetical protein
VPTGCDEEDVGFCGGTCTESADGAPPRVFALASSGGESWLAWRQVHIERDINRVDRSDEAQVCESVVIDDRSTYEVLLARVLEDGHVDVRLRLSTPAPGGFDIVRLAASGDRLVLAATAGATGQQSEVRYLELDASTL